VGELALVKREFGVEVVLEEGNLVDSGRQGGINPLLLGFSLGINSPFLLGFFEEITLLFLFFFLEPPS